MKVSVIGCGRWGSCLAWYTSYVKKYDVVLYGRGSSKDYQCLKENRKNEYIELPKDVRLTEDLDTCIKHGEYIIVSIGAQSFRGFMKDMISRTDISGKTFILCMKGLESSTGSRLSEVFKEESNGLGSVAVWVGPGHIQDFYAMRPSCMIISSDDIEFTKSIVTLFTSSLIRLYSSPDLLGCEIGAASKNVMGIAAGMIDGFDWAGLKGALMARGAAEVSRLIRIMGGDEKTAYGLSHLGDYQATLFSQFSHNRQYGENFIKKVPSAKLAEGVDTSKALIKLAEKYGCDMPITKAVYDVLFYGMIPEKAIESLFERNTKQEFY